MTTSEHRANWLRAAAEFEVWPGSLEGLAARASEWFPDEDAPASLFNLADLRDFTQIRVEEARQLLDNVFQEVGDVPEGSDLVLIAAASQLLRFFDGEDAERVVHHLGSVAVNDPRVQPLLMDVSVLSDDLDDRVPGANGRVPGTLTELAPLVVGELRTRAVSKGAWAESVGSIADSLQRRIALDRTTSFTVERGKWSAWVEAWVPKDAGASAGQGAGISVEVLLRSSGVRSFAALGIELGSDATPTVPRPMGDFGEAADRASHLRASPIHTGLPEEFVSVFSEVIRASELGGQVSVVDAAFDPIDSNEVGFATAARVAIRLLLALARDGRIDELVVGRALEEAISTAESVGVGGGVVVP